MRVGRAALLMLVLWGTIQACAGGSAARPAAPVDALSVWAEFPVDRVPRPIVMLDGPPKWPGFASGDAKLAALCGKVAGTATNLPTDIPAEVKVTWLTGDSGLYPSLSAASAVAALSHPAGKQNGCDSVPSLSISGAHLGAADFPTDRGTASVTSWLFAVPGALGDVAYPALATSALWPGEATVGPQARLSADGKQVTFGFIGSAAGTGPCQAEYTAIAAESATAVAIAPVAVETSRTGGRSGICTAVGYLRTVAVALTSPLGKRVLVDQHGVAVAACPPGWKSSSNC